MTPRTIPLVAASAGAVERSIHAAIARRDPSRHGNSSEADLGDARWGVASGPEADGRSAGRRNPSGAQRSVVQNGGGRKPRADKCERYNDASETIAAMAATNQRAKRDKCAGSQEADARPPGSAPASRVRFDALDSANQRSRWRASRRAEGTSGRTAAARTEPSAWRPARATRGRLRPRQSSTAREGEEFERHVVRAAHDVVAAVAGRVGQEGGKQPKRGGWQQLPESHDGYHSTRVAGCAWSPCRMRWARS